MDETDEIDIDEGEFGRDLRVCGMRFFEGEELQKAAGNGRIPQLKLWTYQESQHRN